MKFNTKLLHGNFQPDKSTGSTGTPIYQSTAFRHDTAEELEKIFKGAAYGHIYTRISNPTVEAFEKRIAGLEKGVGAIACSSGMSAISLAVLNLLEQDDEIVSASGIFGGTYSLFRSLSSYGINAYFAVDSSIDSFSRLISEKTKLIFVETIGNPRLDVPNIQALSQLAHSNGIPLVVDNTVTTPYLIRPFEHGADIVVHSSSKLINGGGNSIGGVIVDSGRFPWSAEKFPVLAEMKKKYSLFSYLAKLRQGLYRDVGACMAPFNAYLTGVGLDTLGLRMEKMCSNAMDLARFLNSHSAVEWVSYPGLELHSCYKLASEQFGGRFGVILTFGVGTKERAFKVINGLNYAYNAANIGDIRTLVIHPASTIYVNFSHEENLLNGVSLDMIRVSVGIEDIEDLTEDFARVLGQL